MTQNDLQHLNHIPNTRRQLNPAKKQPNPKDLVTLLQAQKGNRQETHCTQRVGDRKQTHEDEHGRSVQLPDAE